ncbi:MAG: hypothetical protein C0504_02785 [Candidatus Solibacter sp.]|nr:hypothetical protein [Candidatus Solibacter sp.]
MPALLCRAIAGLDAGLAGAAALIAWFAAGSILGGGLWFSRLNLAAAPFFGDSVFTSGPGWHTAVGAALLLLVYSLLGAAYGLLPASREGWLNLMTALGYAGLVHLCADAWLWKRLHPFAHPYYAPLAVAPGHLIYGLFLWRFPARLHRLTLLLGGRDAIAALAPPPPAVPAPGSAAHDAAAGLSFDPDIAQNPASLHSVQSPSPGRRVPESSPGDGSPPPSSLE